MKYLEKKQQIFKLSIFLSVNRISHMIAFFKIKALIKIKRKNAFYL